MHLTRVIPAMLFLLMTASVLLAGEEPPLDLAPLIQEAINNNPQLQAAQYQTAAAVEEIRQAGAWDPPQVGIDFFQTPTGSFPDPITNNMEYDYYVEQMIPFPGKTAAMTRAAEKNKVMVEQNAKALKQKIIRDVKTAYYDLYLVQRKIAVNEENQALMRDFITIARKQYEVGMGKQTDILKAQTELTMLMNEGITLLQEKKTTEAMLSSLLARPADQPFGVVPDMAETRLSLSFDRMKPLALKYQPELLAMAQTIEMTQAEAEAAETELKPDVTVRFMYKDMANTTEDYWSTMVGVTIPLAFWSADRFQGKVEESRINVRKAGKDRQAMENMVLFQVREALVTIESQQNLMKLLTSTLIPQTEQALRSMMASYQTGGTDFLMMLDTWRTLLTAKLEYHMAVMNLMTGQASLEQAVGLSMEEIAALLQQEAGSGPTSSALR